MPDYVILLVSSAERPEEIDRARAERAKERAEERLRQKQSVREYHLSKAALARAMARLRVRPNNHPIYPDMPRPIGALSVFPGKPGSPALVICTTLCGQDTQPARGRPKSGPSS